MWWQEAVTVLKGIGPKKAQELANLGVFTVGDLLEYYPRQEAYLDYGNLKKIKELAVDGSRQIFCATVYSVRSSFGAHGKRYTVVTVRDETAYASLYFFLSQRFSAQKLKPGMEILVMGRVRPGRTARTVSEVQVQPFEAQEQKKPEILPVYALSGNLTQSNLRHWMREALEKAEQDLPESLPVSVIEKCKLPNRLTALKNIHFPDSWEALKQAKRRFIFEELFLLQCGLLFYRQQNHDQRQGVQHGADGEKIRQVMEHLPFVLTKQQQQVWGEISADMEKALPMHRILQGDVGSGKTVISALALAKAVENGCQGCIMAPTEILAQQHFETLSELLQPAGIRVALLVGGMRVKARRELLLNLELGLIDVLVGTHALLQEDVRFARLSLAVTDEQHRFGVEQRARLANKSVVAPDVLVMTATPIPRTLALTVYGDLDISLMKGRPPGRKPVQTLCYNDEKRREVYEGMLRQVQEGRQAYVVCPLIEESETLQVRSAESVYEELSSGVLRGVSCALLHGRLKNAEKEAIMADFAAGKIKVLVSTTVIEVGVNVPNATLIVIENAERFGLAQLHQLRGRVGRGAQQSYCVLLAGADAPEALARLQVLRDSEDGFYLAEKDLEQRGVGQLFGLRQHGLPDLRIADIIRDTETIVQVRKLAQEELAKPGAWQNIQKLVEMQFGQRFAMIFNT
ncbi:ATP-dependent DNA helicase RecG [uncultured Phascolarctobacterium sp.]|uniref:ATP-dependent DNA helicase RecG n=1 Tax=uncultured Phascolarctobacterium sp. TaxID=512296 RepID=UPI00260BA467|nr:ATP-dependent DNA helicase RecG [uncultured Phascolarctobacterium sp.]